MTDDDVFNLKIHFHHVDPSTRLFTPADRHRNYLTQEYIDEIAKCVALTPSEHQKEHRLMNKIDNIDIMITSMVISYFKNTPQRSDVFTTIHDTPNYIDPDTGVKFYMDFLQFELPDRMNDGKNIRYSVETLDNLLWL